MDSSVVLLAYTEDRQEQAGNTRVSKLLSLSREVNSSR